MKFLCDVHIPYKQRNYLQNQGLTAIHVNEILNKSETDDWNICNYADANDFIVITKDADFVDFYYIRKSPRKLIKISLGNFSTTELLQLFSKALPVIQNISKRSNFLFEIDKDQNFLTDDTI